MLNEPACSRKIASCGFGSVSIGRGQALLITQNPPFFIMFPFIQTTSPNLVGCDPCGRPQPPTLYRIPICSPVSVPKPQPPLSRGGVNLGLTEGWELPELSPCSRLYKQRLRISVGNGFDRSVPRTLVMFPYNNPRSHHVYFPGLRNAARRPTGTPAGGRWWKSDTLRLTQIPLFKRRTAAHAPLSKRAARLPFSMTI